MNRNQFAKISFRLRTQKIVNKVQVITPSIKIILLFLDKQIKNLVAKCILFVHEQRCISMLRMYRAPPSIYQSRVVPCQ